MAKRKRAAKKSGAKKKRATNPKKKSGGRKRHVNGKTTHRRRRRRNPGHPLIAAFVGGGLGRLAGAVGSHGFGSIVKKPGIGKTLAHMAGQLVPLVGAAALHKEHPNLAAGMAGASGGGMIHEGLEHVAMKDKGPPAKWEKWLGVHTRAGGVSLPSGATLYLDAVKGAMTQGAPMANGEEPEPQPVQREVGAGGPLFTVRADGQADRQMQAIGALPGGDLLLVEPRTKKFDTMSGITMPELMGIVKVNGLVEIKGPGDRDDPNMNGIVKVDGEEPGMDGIVKVEGNGYTQT